MTTVETPLSPIEKILDDQNAIAKARTMFARVITFEDESYKSILNIKELNAKVVDLNAEGISKPFTQFPDRALKINVKPRETKYLKIPLTEIAEPFPVISIWVYQTGTVTTTLAGGFVDSNPVGNVQNSWIMLATRPYPNNITTLKIDGGDSGGYIYITLIAYNTRVLDYYVMSYPNKSLDGSTSYSYGVWIPIIKYRRYKVRLIVTIAGDGTNACNVDINLHTVVGAKTVASVSRTANTLASYWIYITAKYDDSLGSDNAFAFSIDVSGYGTFYAYSVIVTPIDDNEYSLNGLKTASASNTSTTVTSYTLIDANGRANRYKQASVSLSSPSGGTAKLYINGVLVADYSGSSGTFNIPDDVDIWEISVELAGNGTTAATANFSGLEIKGPYLVRR